MKEVADMYFSKCCKWKWNCKESAQDLTRSKFVTVVQRTSVQYLNYLQGLFLLVHPTKKIPSWWVSWKAFDGFFQCTYINKLQFKGVGKQRGKKKKAHDCVHFKMSKLYSRSAYIHIEDRFHLWIVEVLNDGHLKVQLVSMMSKHQMSLCVNSAVFSVNTNKWAKKNWL